MTCEFTAEQIRNALIEAFRDGEPDDLKYSLAKLLAIHYPDEYVRLQVALFIDQMSRP
jgi:hypothetical protein